MRVLIQRVREAQLDVDDAPYASMSCGLVVLVGYCVEDVQPETADQEAARRDRLVAKMLGLRIFPDENGKMNKDLAECNGELLIVSQFTLYADCRKGRRPSFHLAAPPREAEEAYNRLVQSLMMRLPGKVKTGQFGADMNIHLVNWGPVTIFLDSCDF